jgi:hypothetical protein
MTPVLCLATLVAFQLFLGVEAWMVRMTAVDVGWQAVIRTAHVLVGSLIFAAALVTTLHAYGVNPRQARGMAPTMENESVPAEMGIRHAEEVAV